MVLVTNLEILIVFGGQSTCFCYDKEGAVIKKSARYSIDTCRTVGCCDIVNSYRWELIKGKNEPNPEGVAFCQNQKKEDPVEEFSKTIQYRGFLQSIK